MKNLLNKVKAFAKRNFWWIVIIMSLLELIIIKDICEKEIMYYQQSVIEQQDKELRTMDYYYIDIDSVSGIGTVTRVHN